MAVTSVAQSAKERVKERFLVAAVVLVQIAWAAALVFLAVHFL